MNAMNHYFTQKATNIVLQDLVDSLLVEDFFEEMPKQLIAMDMWLSQAKNQYGGQIVEVFYQQIKQSQSEDDHILQIQLNTDAQLIIALKPSITQLWQKIPDSPVLLVLFNTPEAKLEKIESVDPITLMNLIFQCNKNQYQDKQEGVQRFLETLAQNIEQLEWSLDHRINHQNLLDQTPARFFQTMEQWASLRDRPYHPLAKAKMGLNETDYKKYLAEFSHPITLNWIAIRNDKLMVGQGVDDEKNQRPMHYFLDIIEQAGLVQELIDRKIADTHVAIPVHPWQLDNVIQELLPEAFAQQECIVLDFKSKPFYATSSLRSMAPISESANYLKLPMSVFSLASSRFLPAIKMINGQKSEKLFRQGVHSETVLKDKVYICDETKWWAYLPENTKDYSPQNDILFTQPPRHLSAMLRHYPDELLQNSDYRLIPMAALGTMLLDSQHHFFDDWMKYLNLEKSENSVKQLFKSLCYTFFDVNLRMFKMGMLGEVHGQNAVFVWKAGKAHGILFRDHDSLRIYVPWLEQSGLADPEYTLKKGYPNTLYHQKPEDLFFYFQTLAIQVNMRAIVDVLAEIYSIQADELWKIMAEIIQKLIIEIDFDPSTQTMLNRLLFEEEYWPFKMLLKPMIDRGNDPGSMPYGKSLIPNPFRRVYDLNRSN